MGQITPNISIYVPADGEKNYGNAFLEGMLNIDQHDHSGGPFGGVPITSTGLANFSVTFDKLNANVVDPTTGIGVNSTPGLQNQLEILGILKNLYQLATTAGFLAKNGSSIAARTFQSTSSITWTNADGSGGDPSANVLLVNVSQGGTGLSSLTTFELLAAGTTATGNLQQIASGNLGDFLVSQGAGSLPLFKSPGSVGQLQTATVTLTAAQFNALNATPIQIVGAPGSGKIIVPISCWAKLNYVAAFTTGNSVNVCYNGNFVNAALSFGATAFQGTANTYYTASQSYGSNTGYAVAAAENQPITLANFGAATGGAGSTVDFYLTYFTITF